MLANSAWHVYIPLCSDGSYYVGHTEDLWQRIRDHNDGLGAKFTFKRRPVRLAYSEPHDTEEKTVQRERQLKGWSRAKKKALIDGDLSRLRRLSKRRKRGRSGAREE